MQKFYEGIKSFTMIDTSTIAALCAVTCPYIMGDRGNVGSHPGTLLVVSNTATGWY